MRAIALALGLTSLLAAPAARADGPEELPPIVITARGPTVFTTIPRAQVRDRPDEPRADLVREVPRSVRREPF